MAGEIVAVLGLVPVCRRHHALGAHANERFGEAGGGVPADNGGTCEFGRGMVGLGYLPA